MSETYEDEQQKLQNELAGLPAEGIQITVPKDPEVKPEVWKDVEPLLYRGFLTLPAEINGVYFVFKSLNHHEFELLRFYGDYRDTKKQAFWDIFLAHCVFVVDGVNILKDRDRWIQKVSEVFLSLPKGVKSDIIRHVSEVNRKASVALTLTEAYAMEPMSRYRWMQLKGLDLSSVSVTGIEGTQQLGLNWAQQLWRALNLVEDRNEQQERDWENAKFVGSCFAGKGISKVYSHDTERRRKEHEERISRKDRILREVLLGEKVDSKNTALPGAVITIPKTVEELASQLEKDLRGEQDWHDKVIEEHERRIKDQYQSRRTQQEEVAKENDVHFGPFNVTGGTALEPISPQEIEHRMQRARQLQAQALANRQVHLDPSDEKTEQFFDKWGATGPEQRVEVSTTDRDISGAIALPVRKPTTTTPFRRK